MNFIDFFLLTWLRTVEPGIFKLLPLHRAELTGTISVDQTTHAERVAQWRTRIEDAGTQPDDIQGILFILDLLFLPIRSALENTTYGSSS